MPRSRHHCSGFRSAGLRCGGIAPLVLVVLILGLFAGGDASVEAAVRDGGISEPRHLDYRFFNFLGIYQKFTTIVRGE